jgi:hypothetical protein
MTFEPDHHHPTRQPRSVVVASLIGLFVGASLWLVVAAGLQRSAAGPMLVPQGPAVTLATRAVETEAEPVPLPGGDPLPVLADPSRLR